MGGGPSREGSAGRSARCSEQRPSHDWAGTQPEALHGAYPGAARRRGRQAQRGDKRRTVEPTMQRQEAELRSPIVVHCGDGETAGECRATLRKPRVRQGRATIGTGTGHRVAENTPRPARQTGAPSRRSGRGEGPQATGAEVQDLTGEKAEVWLFCPVRQHQAAGPPLRQQPSLRSSTREGRGSIGRPRAITDRSLSRACQARM